MMHFFNKLPGHIRYPLGLEWTLLKKLPIIFLLGTFLICIPIINLYLQSELITLEQQKTIYTCLGLLFTHWFFVGAAAIGCVVVIIMKGPGYVADPYELPEEDPNLENNQKFF